MGGALKISTAAAGNLRGIRVLVIEDEMMVAMLVEDMLADLGCAVVAIAGRLEQAVALAQAADCDVAVVDFNLAGQTSLPVAEVLRARGVPFVFATGNSDRRLGPAYSETPVLAKPFLTEQLAAKLTAALAGCR